MTIRFLSFWSINEPVEVVRHCAQLEQFARAGLNGVVFHPRNYPGDIPYLGTEYMRRLSRLILHAKSLNLSFWLYDENGWPSGSVGGEMLRRHPDARQQWLGVFPKASRFSRFEFDAGGRRAFADVRPGPGVDYFNPRVSRWFVELTHQRYRDALDPEAFAHVEAMFCDEPAFGLCEADVPEGGAVPWTPDLPERFEARYGRPLRPLVPALFHTCAESRVARIQLWELLRDLFCERFLDPIREWCEHHGMRFTGHVKGEEHPLFQVPMTGSCSRVYRSFSLPGIDALERHPSGDFFPRQLVSSAAQFSDGRAMAEVFGGSGWGAGPQDLEAFLLWLGRHGITDFVLHISQSRLDSAAIRDWPPSHPLHVSWNEVYPRVLERVRHALEISPAEVPSLLVVSPHRAIMGEFEPAELRRINLHNAAEYSETKAARINRDFLKRVDFLENTGAHYHITDEATFEQHCRSRDDGIQLGNVSYRHLMIDPDAAVAPEIRKRFSRWETRADDVAAAKRVERGHARSAKEEPASETPLALPHWNFETPVNSLLLDGRAGSDGGFCYTFEAEPAVRAVSGIRIITVDPVSDLRLNGISCEPDDEEDRRGWRVPARRLREDNEIHLQARAQSPPFLWIKGQFRVFSRSPFAYDSKGMARTKGPFFLSCETPDPTGHDLVSDGFPFLFRPLTACIELEIPVNAEFWTFKGQYADAIEVSIDGERPAWIWGPHWCRQGFVPAGRHRIEIRVIPSSFNHYGPHHYIYGDRHVISPAQWQGIRNFADPPDAPQWTHDEYWRFRRLAFPQTLILA